MKLKFLNTKGAVFVLAAMMVNTGPVLAGALTLTGGTVNSCSSYTGYNADANGNLTVTCSGGNTESTSPTAAPTCTLTASPSTISANASSMLIANCSPAATSFAWTGTNFTGSGGNVSPTSTTTYSVTGSNIIGDGNTPSVTVTVSTTGPTTGPTTGQRTTPPIPTAPLTEIRLWNYAFEAANSIAHNVKLEPVSYMSYLKTIYANKPAIFKLPIW